MDFLKLLALDNDDLAVIAAHCQDAIIKVADMRYLPAEKRFIVACNRFVWEKAEQSRKKTFERRRAALHFERIMGAQVAGIDLQAKDGVLDLLTITFDEGDAPSGHVLLHFAGGGTIRLNAECLEAKLSDLGAAWETDNKPAHDLD